MLRIIYFLTLMGLIASCRSITYTTQADRSADLGDYTTFSWAPGDMEKAISESDYVNEPVYRLIRSKVMKEMILKGFRYEVESPEVLVDIKVIGEPVRDQSNEADYDYWTGYELPENIDPGSLIIELIDVETNRVVWQGVATDALPQNPSPNESKMDRIVSQLFTGYHYKVI